ATRHEHRAYDRTQESDRSHEHSPPFSEGGSKPRHRTPYKL
ncbi:MAG: hypothetical protein AVDCRST_MAG58-1894, partial [uncultured Rubrobacteraceae bacterium]